MPCPPLPAHSRRPCSAHRCVRAAGCRPTRQRPFAARQTLRRERRRNRNRNHTPNTCFTCCFLLFFSLPLSHSIPHTHSKIRAEKTNTSNRSLCREVVITPVARYSIGLQACRAHRSPSGGGGRLHGLSASTRQATPTCLFTANVSRSLLFVTGTMRLTPSITAMWATLTSNVFFWVRTTDRALDHLWELEMRLYERDCMAANDHR